jgi:hypothetical protein
VKVFKKEKPELKRHSGKPEECVLKVLEYQPKNMSIISRPNSEALFIKSILIDILFAENSSS